MTTNRQYLALALALASLATALPAWAVTGGVATGAYPFVGRVQSQITLPGNFYATGSYIAPGVVLTAGHAGNEVIVSGVSYVAPVFERFEIGGVQYFALAVQEPNYVPAAANFSDHDLSTLQLINGPAAPGGTFPTLATAADPALVAGSTVSVVGFKGSAVGGNPLLGTMTIKNPIVAGDISPNTYTFRKPPSANLTEPGDSGGPQLFDFGVAGGGVKIVSTTSAGNTTTVTTTTRIDTAGHNSFIIGNGDGGRAINRLSGAANVNWSTATWALGSAAANNLPAATNVVILDPTTAANAATTTVTLDVNSAALDGLANDVTLVVNGKTLSVPGSTGILNTGAMNISGAAGSTVTTGMKFDNVGALTVGANGSLTMGASLPAAVTIADSMLIDRGSTANVTDGGTITIHSPTNSAQLNLQGTGALTISGNGLQSGSVTADWINNSSGGPTPTVAGINVNSGGLLTVNAITVNNVLAGINVTGGANGAGVANVGTLINSSLITVNKGGQLNMSRDLTLLIPGDALTNGTPPGGLAGSILQVNGGGTATVTGTGTNNGTIAINNTGGIGLVSIVAPAVGSGRLTNAAGAFIEFTNTGGTKPAMDFTSANLVNLGNISGSGTFVLTGNSSVDDRATVITAPTINLNQMDALFEGAVGTAGAPVTMETTTQNFGAVLAGFSDPFAWNDICVLANSKVQLTDGYNNEVAGAEVLYTTSLGVAANSTLDLNGLTLYYQYANPNCGLVLANVTNGTLIQVPEPASLLLLSLSTLLLTRRR